jgi:hypothetical protein
MSHGDLDDKEGAEKWVRENAREFAIFLTEYPDVEPRRLIRIWFERCFVGYGWPIQVLGKREVPKIFYEELANAQNCD